jgi:hypothetical protein
MTEDEMMDVADRMLDGLKEQGYNSLRDYKKKMQFQKAMQEHERYLSRCGEYKRG